MQINKIMHPRLNTDYLNRRRDLYKAQDWDKYEKCIVDNFRQSIQVSSSGYEALQKMLGLSQADLQKSIFNHSTNLDYAELMEEFVKEEVTPQTSQPTAGRRQLSKDQVFEVLQILNESQYKAAREAQEHHKDKDQNDENVIESIQLWKSIETTKTRDMLFVDR